MAYDPVVEALKDALDIRCPTYVDDLAAFTFGPAQTMRAMRFLLFASRAVGLEIETHTCKSLCLKRPCTRRNGPPLATPSTR